MDVPTLRQALLEIDSMKSRFHEVKHKCETKLKDRRRDKQKQSTTEKFDVVLDDLRAEFSKIALNGRYGYVNTSIWGPL